MGWKQKKSRGVQTNVNQTMRNFKKNNYTLIFWIKTYFAQTAITLTAVKRNDIYFWNLRFILNYRFLFLRNLFPESPISDSAFLFPCICFFGDGYFHKIKNKQTPLNSCLVKFYIPAFYLSSILVWRDICHFSFITTVITRQHYMLDAGGNVAGASHQGNNLKHLVLLCSDFSAPQAADQAEVIFWNSKCWEQNDSKLLFVSSWRVTWETKKAHNWNDSLTNFRVQPHA